MLLSLVLHWVVTAIVLMIIDAILPGFAMSGFGTALIAALVLGLVNFFIRPLLALLTLPLNIITLGLFSFVLNAIMLALVAWLVPGFEIENFLSALVGALLLALMIGLLNMILPDRSRIA